VQRVNMRAGTSWALKSFTFFLYTRNSLLHYFNSIKCLTLSQQADINRGNSIIKLGGRTYRCRPA